MRETAHEVPPEVPLPSPRHPEREPERSPAFEHVTIGVQEASVWVAELRQRARDFVRRNGGEVRAIVLLADGERLNIVDVQSGPGADYVTLSSAEPHRELIIRLDQLVRIEFAVADADTQSRFRVRGNDVGFTSR